ncbi:MAG: phosphomannomutase/phosphoglucomutase [Anaerolineales bacterium]
MAGIFKAYDIRGLAPQEINAEIARKIGAAFGQYLEGGRIVIGRDMRETSASLATALAAGALSSGLQVFDIGMATTPMLYSAIIRRDFRGGAMITASHLPKQYNGIKLCREKAIPLSGDQGLPEIEALTRHIDTPPQSQSQAQKIDFLGDYIDELSTFIEGNEHLKVVVDAGNGMGGLDTPRLIPRFEHCDFITMLMNPDGEFPVHVPNPAIPSTTEKLQERVKTENAALGIAFDGDGDRCGFIDEKGGRIPADLMIAVLAEYFLAKSPGATILYDLRSSRAIPERIRELGGKPVKTRVGHSFIKSKMREDSAVFAGELSGHYYFQDLGYIDCGLMAMVVMLNLLGKKQQSMSELVRPLMKYARSGEINISTKEPDRMLEVLASAYKDGEQVHLDGLSVEYPSWWFNLRKSNTEPVVRLVIEADNEDILAQKKSELMEIVHQNGGEVSDSE